MQITSLHIVGQKHVRGTFRKKVQREDLLMNHRQSAHAAAGAEAALENSVLERIQERFSNASHGVHDEASVSDVQDPGLLRLRKNIDCLEALHSRLEFMMDEIQSLIRRS